MNQEKKKIAVFGGTFDPVTLGHCEILLMLCILGIFDKILVIPSGRRSDKNKVATPDQIVRMVEIAIESLPACYQGIVEIDKRDIYTENTPTATLMRNLYREYGRETTDLYFVVGGDLVEPLEQYGGHSHITGEWLHGKVLWSENKFVVVPRLGYRNPNEFGLDPEKCIVLPNPPPETSSSAVRQMRKSAQGWEHLVGNKDLVNFIKQNNLYT